MLFAALFAPAFPLQAALRFRPELRDGPTAVTDGLSQKGHILALTAAAGAAGVEEGLSSSQALARCPGLTLLSRELEQEKIASQILLEIAASLSPDVEDTSAGICTISLAGARIADFESWADEVRRRCEEVRLTARIGVAETPDLALLAAHAATPILVVRDSTAFLASRELSELSPTPEMQRILQDWGIRNLGALAALSKSEATVRLGTEAAQLWERATGRAQRLLRCVRPAEQFVEAFEFEQEIETTEPLLFLLRRFLEQLSVRLRAAYRVAAQMRLELPLENGAAHTRHFTIPAPTADVEPLFRILHTHLESLRLEQRPVALRLEIQPGISSNRQLQIFENPLRDPNRFGETLGRLGALAGGENVGSPRQPASRRPGEIELAPPDFGAQPAALLEESPPDLGIGLPLRRHRPPLAARVELEQGRPAAVFSSGLSGPIVDALGPYRLSGDWWDAQAWAVEEWDVEMSDGSLGRIARRGADWFIEGRYE